MLRLLLAIPIILFLGCQNLTTENEKGNVEQDHPDFSNLNCAYYMQNESHLFKKGLEVTNATIEFYKNLIECKKSLGPAHSSSLGSSYKMFAQAYEQLGDFKNASIQMRKNIMMLEEKKKIFYINENKHYLGYLEGISGDYENGKALIQESVDYFIGRKDSASYIEALTNLFRLEGNRKNFDTAETYYQEILAYHLKDKNNFGLFRLRTEAIKLKKLKGENFDVLMEANDKLISDKLVSEGFAKEYLQLIIDSH